MITFGRVIDRVSRVAPLGLRFWDSVSRSVVCEGLQVVGYPPDNPLRRTPATINHSGVYVLQGLPGLREAEHGEGDDGYWQNVETRPFVVEVSDLQGRFQPFLLDLDVPVRGVYDPAYARREAHWPRDLAAVPLSPSPTYLAPGAMAVVRAELWDPVNERPASWAMLELRTAPRPGGQTLTQGYADEKGRVLLVFAYPEPAGVSPASPPAGSPPDSTKVPLWEQTWPFHVAAYYEFRDPTPTIPDLREVLEQDAADLWADDARTLLLNTLTLSFGRQLVLKSEDRTDGRLLVTER